VHFQADALAGASCWYAADALAGASCRYEADALAGASCRYERNRPARDFNRFEIFEQTAEGTYSREFRLKKINISWQYASTT
jgi:hypothetical protein